ncbi:MAG: hypothetical protein A2X36_01565 [Elusimicrobia bacterium GWA2_69_24]|nr:MAG: hypothetical protein A2X36_01565 [Elusimicrobia bacterium GWA2_69_24]HBL19150.1 hypothetical protein [Elusimicrobiota bacterium]
MSDCKICGCSGWFFFITSDGLCRHCAHLTSIDIEARSRAARDSAKAAEQTLNPQSKIVHLDLALSNLETLADYEKRGIPSPGGSAEESLRKARSERDRLVLRTARQELVGLMRRVRAEEEAEAKVALYTGFLRKLQEYEASLADPKPIASLKKKVEGGVVRIRLNALVAKARRCEASADMVAARRLYGEALAYLKMKGADDPAATGYRAKIESCLQELP